MKFLDLNGTQHLIKKMKELFVLKESNKGLSTNDYTTIEKEKLAGVEVGANKYVHPPKHTPAEIEENETKRFVSDAQIANWNNKVNKDGNKVLSTNDFTNGYKNKLDGIESGSQANKIETIKRNGVPISITSKAVDIKVPVKLSELNNDKEYQTKTETIKLIQEIGKLKKVIVDVLPKATEADENTIYLVKKETINGQDSYEEYMVIDGKFEKLGDSKKETIDLSGYLKKTDLVAITTNEIDQAFA